MVEVKFCGLTRATDAEHALALGAHYAGVIFAGGPRRQSVASAREVFAPLTGTATRRVGVIGRQRLDEVLAIADTVPLDVLQFHNGVDGDTVLALQTRFAGAIWRVVQVDAALGRVASDADTTFAQGVDAVVLDARAASGLGGTGIALDWTAIAPDVARLRHRGRVVLAGGLRPENVAQAAALVRPDVVDVSSGVERAPGIKDPEQMRAFALAIRPLEV